jgi:hypothetical protein
VVVHAVSGARGVTITQAGKSVKTSAETNGTPFAGTRTSIRSDQFGNALLYEFDALSTGSLAVLKVLSPESLTGRASIR